MRWNSALRERVRFCVHFLCIYEAAVFSVMWRYGCAILAERKRKEQECARRTTCLLTCPHTHTHPCLWTLPLRSISICHGGLWYSRKSRRATDGGGRNESRDDRGSQRKHHLEKWCDRNENPQRRQKEAERKQLDGALKTNRTFSGKTRKMRKE